MIETWSRVDSCSVLTRHCSADWWSVGILLYELLCGEAPFACSTNKLTYEFIAYSSKMPYFPAHVSQHARDLISRLLCRCGRCRFSPFHRNVCSHCVIQGCQSAFGVRRRGCSSREDSSVRTHAPLACTPHSAASGFSDPSTGSSFKQAKFLRLFDSMILMTSGRKMPTRARLRYPPSPSTGCSVYAHAHSYTWRTVRFMLLQAVLDDTGKKPAEGLGVENAFKDFDFSRTAATNTNSTSV